MRDRGATISTQSFNPAGSLVALTNSARGIGERERAQEVRSRSPRFFANAPRPSKRDVKRSTFGGHTGGAPRAVTSRRQRASDHSPLLKPCEVGGRSPDEGRSQGGGRNPVPAPFSFRDAQRPPSFAGVSEARAHATRSTGLADFQCAVH